MRLMRPKEVAKETGLGYHYVLSLMASGALPAVRLPGRAFDLIDAADVEKLVAAAKSGSVPGSKLSDDAQKDQSRPAPQKQSRKRKKSGQFQPNRVSIEEFRRAH